MLAGKESLKDVRGVLRKLTLSKPRSMSRPCRSSVTESHEVFILNQSFRIIHCQICRNLVLFSTAAFLIAKECPWDLTKD